MLIFEGSEPNEEDSICANIPNKDLQYKSINRVLWMDFVIDFIKSEYISSIEFYY